MTEAQSNESRFKGRKDYEPQMLTSQDKIISTAGIPDILGILP